MGSMWIMLVAVICFLVAYLTYARRLTSKWGMDDKQLTPAHEKKDGIDYVPAKKPVLLGHHFASIAGAAPIIGPVAASQFGWFPVMLWIILGGIFIGAVHDMGSIFSSVRHGGRSIAQVIEKNVGYSGKQLFSIFAWLTLVLIIAAFMNVVANAFVSTPEAATAEVILIAMAIAFGLFRHRTKLSMPLQMLIGIVIVVVAVAVGLNLPLAIPFNTWLWIFVIYTFIASVTPVWILLQPRDFLLSFLLYAMLIGTFIGILVGNPGLELTGFTSFQTELGYLFPILFVTVACGAISGFHSLVSSGTTSKQLDKESDSKTIGYGGMLLECTLATVALLAAAVFTSGEASALIAEGGPVLLFANGVGVFLGFLGIPAEVGVVFGTLTVAAFAMTTLDTATRLGRYIFQEYFVPEKAEKEGQEGLLGSRYFATLVTLLFAASLAFTGAWDAIWPIFGSANQLLAALALLSLAVWLASRGIKNLHVVIPMIFMFAVTLVALIFVFRDNLVAANYILAIIAVVLFVMAVVLARMAFGLLKPREEEAPESSG